MPKSLSNLLKHAENIKILRETSTDPLIRDICFDSRKAGPGSMFFAISGTRRKGTDFTGQAVEQGAAAVLVPGSAGEAVKTQVTGDVWLLAADAPHLTLGQVADAFYGHPSRKINVIGITGTNGKTTCSFLLERILEASGKECGLSGTIFQKAGGKQRASALTTPDAVSFQHFLAGLAAEGAEYAVVEVSSHGLVQGRVEGCSFKMAIFTNLSHDHLDYHGSMEEYFRAKLLLFTKYRPEISVINLDDPWGQRIWKKLQGRGISYGFSKDCMVTSVQKSFSVSGTETEIRLGSRHLHINSSLIGRHNLYNILAAAAAAHALGIGREHIKKGIESVKCVPGRLERVVSPGGITALVDYAHTPHALQNVLACLDGLKSGRLITVTGCGGDRDRTKRPEMAEIAARLSDICIFTSDNPRTESADAILQDMLSGIGPGLEKKVVVIRERKPAILKAASIARPGDILLVAGKGHEDYQIIGRKKLPFDDRKVLKEAFEAEELTSGTNPGGKIEFTLNDLQEVLSGKILSGSADTAFSSICTDTRAIRPGQLFWVLRGENFDGHSFVRSACEKGAAGAVVEYTPEGLPPGFPLLKVEEGLRSLGDMAAWYRDRIGCKVFAITGSCGKTTTKDLVLSIMKTCHTASGTAGNFNNLVGLPLTILSLSPSTEWAVLEMGTNLPGEIARLCEIARPLAGLITCIRPVHLEGLGTLKNIAEEKAALFRSLPQEGTAVINLDDPMVKGYLPAITCRNITGYTSRAFGAAQRIRNLVVLKEVRQNKDGLTVVLDMCGNIYRVRSKLFGRVNALNILAAAAAGVALGIDGPHIVEGIEKVQPCAGRMHAERLPGEWLLIDDSYNANPSSVEAAMETLSDITEDARKTFILGDMLELGPDSLEFHRKAGKAAAACAPELLLTVGELAAQIAQGARESGLPEESIYSFESTENLLEWLSKDPEGFFNGSRRAVLVKASRGIGLEKAARFIEKRLREGE